MVLRANAGEQHTAGGNLKMESGRLHKASGRAL